MNITKSKFMSNTATMIGAALLLSSVSSMAAVGEKKGSRYYEWGGNYLTIGNTHANNSVYARSYSRSDFDANQKTSTQTAVSDFNVTSGLFTKKVKLLESHSSATANRTSGDWNSVSIARTKLHGESVYSNSDYKKKGQNKTSRAKATTTFEKTFYKHTAKYKVKFITLSFTGSAKGRITATAEGKQSIHKNKGAYRQDDGIATANGTVALIASAKGGVGVPGVAYAGLFADFDLANVSNHTASTTKRRHYYDNPRNSQRRYSGSIYSKYDINLGGGKFGLKVKLATVFTVLKRTLVTWKGVTVAQRIFADHKYDEYFSS